MARCAGIKRDGGRCAAIVDGSYCYQHDPARAEERRRNASRAARRKPSSKELAGIKALLEDLTDRVLGKEGMEPIATGAAAVVNQLINTRLRAIDLERKIREADELEERLEALERAVEASAEARGGEKGTWAG